MGVIEARHKVGLCGQYEFPRKTFEKMPNVFADIHIAQYEFPQKKTFEKVPNVFRRNSY